MLSSEPMLNYKTYKWCKPGTPKDHRPTGGSAWDISETLVRTLEWSLENNHAVCWSPCDPDVSISVYPDDSFPLSPAHPAIIVAGDDENPFEMRLDDKMEFNTRKVFYSDKAQKEINAYQARKAKLGGKHPDDPVCVILRIDASTFGKDGHSDAAGYGGYSSSGPALILNPSRRKFTRFVKQLKAEARPVVRAWKTLERIKRKQQPAESKSSASIKQGALPKLKGHTNNQKHSRKSC